MKKIHMIFILLILIAVGCGGKDKAKPSADSLLATDAFQSIEQIKEAYMNKNISFLENHLDTGLAERVLKDLFFEQAVLTFTPIMVKIKEEFVTVQLNWHGSWLIVSDKTIQNRGAARLVLDKETMKLMQVEGDNPFQTPKLRHL